MTEVRTGSDQLEWYSKSNPAPLHMRYKSNAQAEEALHLLICPLKALCHCFMHASSPTHTPYKPIMSPRLMHRTTQLKPKWTSTHSSPDTSMQESPHCVCVFYNMSLTTCTCILCALVCLLWEAEQRWQLQLVALWPVAYRPIRQQYWFAVSSSLRHGFFGRSPWNTKAIGAWTWSRMPRLVWTLLTKEENNNFPQENPGRKRTVQFSRVLHCSQRNLSQISALTGQPQLTIIVSQRQYLLPTTLCASEIAYTMVHLLWPWYICLRLCLFSLGQKENHSWFLHCCAFPHFCHSYYFMKSESWCSVSFQFPFEQSPSVPSSHVKHLSENSILCQETTNIPLKHSIKFAIPF